MAGAQLKDIDKESAASMADGVSVERRNHQPCISSITNIPVTLITYEKSTVTSQIYSPPAEL